MAFPLVVVAVALAGALSPPGVWHGLLFALFVALLLLAEVAV